MNQKDIVESILSKDPVRIEEAKQGLKTLLNTKAAEFRKSVSAFAGRKIFEGTETIISETHTLNGPFGVGTTVHDTVKGIYDVKPAVEGGSEHIDADTKADPDPSQYGPESIPKLKNTESGNALPGAIAALQGKFTDAK
jgi:hypothetical protein